MNNSKPYELELTPDRRDYVERVARKEARKHCSKFVDENDVVQNVHLSLLRKPPKYNPNRRATEKTFLYAVVRYIVLKYAEREARQAKRHRQLQDRP